MGGGEDDSQRLGGSTVKGKKQGVLKENTHRLGGDPSPSHLLSDMHCLSLSQPKRTLESETQKPHKPRPCLLRADCLCQSKSYPSSEQKKEDDVYKHYDWKKTKSVTAPENSLNGKAEENWTNVQSLNGTAEARINT